MRWPLNKIRTLHVDSTDTLLRCGPLNAAVCTVTLLNPAGETRVLLLLLSDTGKPLPAKLANTGQWKDCVQDVH